MYIFNLYIFEYIHVYTQNTTMYSVIVQNYTLGVHNAFVHKGKLSLSSATHTHMTYTPIPCELVRDSRMMM